MAWILGDRLGNFSFYVRKKQRSGEGMQKSWRRGIKGCCDQVPLQSGGERLSSYRSQAIVHWILIAGAEIPNPHKAGAAAS